MPHQLAITVRAEVAAGQADALEALLRSMRAAGTHLTQLPFGELTGVHFARLFVLPGAPDPVGGRIPDSLVYMCDVDAPLRRHLSQLAALPGLDGVFGRCVGYPVGDPSRREEWLRDQLVESAAAYVHTVGRSLDQVQGEARLRERLEDFIDASQASGAIGPDARASAVHRRIRAHVQSTEDLRWAARPAGRPGLFFRARELAHQVAVPVVLLLAAPVLIPSAVVWVLLLRLRERTDMAESGPVDLDHVRAVEAFEERAAQNPFTGFGFVKPGRLRGGAMRAGLFLLDYANRHLFARNTLAGVRTIHFARWVPVDDGRRLLFATSYNGSLESYQDDFIERLWWGINPVFSNGAGFPSTRWLFFDGCKDEPTFKDYERRHLLPTTVYYSAYDTLTARNIDTNSEIRAGLARDLDDRDAATWLALL
jgi:hypothetical protein